MEVLESTENRGQLSADDVHTEIQARVLACTPALQAELGIAQPELVEVPVPGPHRLLVLDETSQPTGNFKYNGAALAVRQALRRNPDIELFLSGTAGNFGAALAQAATKAGRKAVLTTPVTIPEAKRRNIERAGGEVFPVEADVLGAIAVAETVAAEAASRVFIHPFDNLDAIAGQSLVGERVVAGLQAVDGPVEVLVQRGGGSLLSGIASAVRAAGLAQVRVHEVRPELAGGSLDLRYDGLAVARPGGYAGALIADSRFVHGRVEISEADTGRAAHCMARTFGKRYEPSGLAGTAAFEKLAAQTTTPTTYIAVLSGANVSPETFADFMDAPRREQTRLLASLAFAAEEDPNLAVAPAAARNHTWSSPTAAWR